MPSVKRGNGTWDKAPGTAPGHFERSDGRVMTQDEIAAVGKVVGPVEASRASMAARFAHERAEAAAQREKAPAPQAPAPRAPAATSTPGALSRSDEIWEAVQRLGTQIAAAAELEVAQGSIQSGLKTYMRQHGIRGPLPGLLPKRVRSELVVERTRPFVEARSTAIDAAVPEPEPTPEPINEPTGESLDERADQVVAAAAATAPWRTRLEELYIDLLVRRAEEAPTNDPVFDRIERLLGMLGVD